MRFCLDAMPLKKNLIEINDYNGIIVYSAVSDPLFKYNGTSISPHACSEYTIRKRGKLYLIKLRTDLFDFNGRQIQAADYSAVLNNARTLDTNIKYLLDNIADIRTDGLLLTIYLHKSDYQFYKVLSKINFSPVSGPFYIKQISKTEIILAPNKYYRTYTNGTKGLRFGLYDNKQKIDFSCNTNLTETFIKKHRNDLSIYPSFITISLAFINPELLQPEHSCLRQTLLQNINADTIAQKHTTLHPTNTFCESVNHPTAYMHSKSIQDLNKREISIGYDNFYPNIQILKAVKQQLLHAGITVKLVRDDYYNPKYNYDLKLMLSYPDYIDDIAFYRSQYFLTLLRLSCGGRHIRIVKKLYRPTIKQNILVSLNKIMLDNALIIPLFKLDSAYISENTRFDFRIFNYDQLNIKPNSDS